jgi:hypothetical protein
MNERTGHGLDSRGALISLADGVKRMGESNLARDIEQVVHDRTGGQIRKLRVEVGPDGARMHGLCSTFYCKQLAQHAAMRLLGSLHLSNEIEVS